MINRVLFLVFLAIISLYAYASTPDSSKYILLKSGEHVFGNSIEIKEKGRRFLFWKHSDHRVIVDGIEYHGDRVRLVCAPPDPCVALLMDVSKYNEPDFAERIREGNLNLYRATIVTHRILSSPGGIGAAQQHRQESKAYFYNRGLGEIKRANYRNLYGEYRANPLARSDLNKSLLAATGKYVFSYGFMAAYLAHYTNVIFFTDDNFFDHFFLIQPYENDLSNMALNAGVYVGTVMIGMYLDTIKDRLFVRSIETYNKSRR